MKVTFLMVTALAFAEAIAVQQPEGELMEKETGRRSQVRSLQSADQRDRRFWSFLKKIVKKIAPLIDNNAPKIVQAVKVGFQMSAIQKFRIRIACLKGKISLNLRILASNLSRKSLNMHQKLVKLHKKS